MSKKSARKRVVNVRLLVASLVLLALIVPVSYFWHQHRLAKTSDLLLARAEQLEQNNKWGRATAYYQRYLLLEPEDTEVLVRLVQAYSKGEINAQRIARLNKLLFQTLGRAPERDDLRLMLAENLLLVSNFAKAEEEAQILIDRKAAEKNEARKIIALSQFYQVKEVNKKEYYDALHGLRVALDSMPGDFLLAQLYANELHGNAEAIREQRINIDFEIDNPKEESQLIMDRMVAADENNADARVARFRYRWRFKLPHAEEDLEHALQLDSEHSEALMLLGQIKLIDEKDLDGAEKLLRRARQASPEDGRIYLIMAELYEKKGNPDGAIEMLREGSKAANGFKIEIDIALINSLITAQDFETAETVLEHLDRMVPLRLAQIDSTEKIQLENRMRLLHARLALAKQQVESAIKLLEAVVFSSRPDDSGGMTPEAFQAKALLAKNLTIRQRWVLASEHWDDLAMSRPHQSEVVLAAAQCAFKANKPEKAIGYLERFLPYAKSQAKDQLANTYVQLVQSHLAAQLRLPTAERNWEKFLASLREARQEIPQRWEISIAAMKYLLNVEAASLRSAANAQDGQSPAARLKEQTVSLLQNMEKQFPSNANVWRQISLAYQRLDMPEDSQKALEQFRKLESSLSQVVTLEAALLTGERNYAEAEQVLVAALPKLNGIEKLQAELTRLKILAQTDQLDEAKTLVNQLHVAEQANPVLIMMGAEIFLKAEDYQTAKKWENLLENEPLYEFERDYLRARRLLATYDDLSNELRRDLSSLLQDLYKTRPRWSETSSLLARYYEKSEDYTQALEYYQQAIKLGDRSPKTMERVVSLLTAQGRLNEAQEYLSQLAAVQPDNSQLELAEISLAVQQKKLGHAIKLAQQGLEKNADDPMKYVVLANLLLQDGQAENSEQVIRQATDRFPEDQRAWHALFALLIELERPEEARKVLASLVEKLDGSAGRRDFVLAQAHDKLGDQQEAHKHYQLAIQAEPKDVVLRLNFAKSLLRTDQAAARDQYETILKLENGNNDEARRTLAQLLVDSGNEGDAARALELLQSSENTAAMVRTLDNRLRAYLLTKMGNTHKDRLNNCIKAQKILEQEVESNQERSRIAARLLLARVFEQQARLKSDESDLKIEAAREQYRRLVNRSEPSIDHLKFYIEFLFRNAKPGSTNAAQYLSDAKLRLAELKRAQQREELETETLENLRLQIHALRLAGQLEEAKQSLNDFAEQRESTMESGDSGKRERGQLYAAIASLFTTLEQHDQAEIWYRQLVELYPDMYASLASCLAKQERLEDAVDICIQIAKESDTSTRPVTVLLNLLSSAKRKLPNQVELESLIHSTLETQGQDINLLMSAAIWKVSQQKTDAAIALFRQVIEISPRNTIAMNNLATLLAERPEQLPEALQQIKQAIAIDGRQQPLLDTQGTIYLKMNEPEQAIACLEEATIGSATDPRYYFHLAAAYDLAGQPESAQENFELARENGLGEALLTEDDRKILIKLQSKLNLSARVDQ